MENDQCVVTARTSDMCGNSYGESQPHINSKEQITTCSSGTSPFLNSSAKMSETNLCTNQGSQACAHWQGAGLFPAVLRTFLFAKGFVLIVLPRHWRTGPPSLCRLLYQHQVCSAAPNFTKGQMETTHRQPLGAALGQRKPFLCTTGPGEGGREGWRKSCWFPLFQKEERRGRS